MHCTIDRHTQTRWQAALELVMAAVIYSVCMSTYYSVYSVHHEILLLLSPSMLNPGDYPPLMTRLFHSYGIWSTEYGVLYIAIYISPCYVAIYISEHILCRPQHFDRVSTE